MSYLASYMAALEAGTQRTPLALGTQIGLGSAAATSATIATGSITVSVGDFLVVAFMTRGGSASPRTHDSLTPTTWACTFTQAADVPQEDTSGGAHLRLSLWSGIVATGGSGILTGTTSGTTFQQALRVIRVPGGVSVQDYAEGSDQSGDTQSAAWNGTPSAAGLTIAVSLNETVANTPALASHDAIADFAGSLGSSPKWAGWQKLLTPASPISVTGMASNRAQLVAAVQIIGA